MNRFAYEERKRVYLEAISQFGEEKQMLMVIEEMSELTKEICKYFRGRKNKAEIAEEIADVTIMLEQLQIMQDNSAEVCEQMDEKVKKLAGKIGVRISPDMEVPVLLSDCGLSNRAYNALRRGGFITMQDVVKQMSWKSKFLSINGLGYLLAEEIIEKAHRLGFTFAWEKEDEK